MNSRRPVNSDVGPLNVKPMSTVKELLEREDFFDASDKATGGVRSPLLKA